MLIGCLYQIILIYSIVRYLFRILADLLLDFTQFQVEPIKLLTFFPHFIILFLDLSLQLIHLICSSLKFWLPLPLQIKYFQLELFNLQCQLFLFHLWKLSLYRTGCVDLTLAIWVAVHWLFICIYLWFQGLYLVAKVEFLEHVFLVLCRFLLELNEKYLISLSQFLKTFFAVTHILRISLSTLANTSVNWLFVWIFFFVFTFLTLFIDLKCRVNLLPFLSILFI